MNFHQTFTIDRFEESFFCFLGVIDIFPTSVVNCGNHVSVAAVAVVGESVNAILVVVNEASKDIDDDDGDDDE